MTIRSNIAIVAAAIGLALASAGGAQAPGAGPGLGRGAQASGPGANWRADGPRVLVMTYRAAPAARAGLRRALRTALLPRLGRLRASGDLANYRVLANRYVDAASWDALVMLEFKNSAALARWREVEDAAPAGLTPDALQAVSAIETTPGTLMRASPSARRAGGPAPVYLVVPYDYLVSTDEYLRYVDGYLLPQLEGWTREQALDGYQLFLPRYAAGRAWSSLLVLAYRGDAGLDARDRVVQSVRARLAATSPEWKAFSDAKGNIRAEKQPIVADDLTP